MRRYRLAAAALIAAGCGGQAAPPPPMTAPVPAKPSLYPDGPPTLGVGSECLVIPADPPRPVILIEHDQVSEVPAGTKVRIVADPSPTDPSPTKDAHPEQRQVTVNVLEGPLSGRAGMVARYHLQPAK